MTYEGMAVTSNVQELQGLCQTLSVVKLPCDDQLKQGHAPCGCLTYHHRHFVEGWLPVEQNHVSILQMPLDLVAILQMHIAVLTAIPQIKALPIFPDDEASACLPRRGVRAILY